MLTSKLKPPGLEFSGTLWLPELRSVRSFVLSLCSSSHLIPYLKARPLHSSSRYYPPCNGHWRGLSSLTSQRCLKQCLAGRSQGELRSKWSCLHLRPSFFCPLPTKSSNYPHTHRTCFLLPCTQAHVCKPVHLRTQDACRGAPSFRLGTRTHMDTVSHARGPIAPGPPFSAAGAPCWPTLDTLERKMIVQPSCLSLAAHLCLGFFGHGAGLVGFCCYN